VWFSPIFFSYSFSFKGAIVSINGFIVFVTAKVFVKQPQTVLSPKAVVTILLPKRIKDSKEKGVHYIRGRPIPSQAAKSDAELLTDKAKRFNIEAYNPFSKLLYSLASLAKSFSQSAKKPPIIPPITKNAIIS